ncbi:winged helix-turn-helix transcriptional regulator [Kribbella sp. CA-293567]|uniref:winged helix-turn-helix transcriptional regulator n=1 Tax=Kribbella sp. CA-293567 TaxID=3002436 RepID=UPI0022DD0581|nr:helix-turn-helix domain-containing protein [Kribbella sp. CA-293567]WBQ04364.1 helix-turn-helix domain-containing protein [Kribbella sp. CA-293567]
MMDRFDRPRAGSRGGVQVWLPDGRPADAYSAMCPSRRALDRIADKWTALIVGALGSSALRFGALSRSVDGISEKMLTQTLRSLQRDGLVSRRVVPGAVSAVEYELTALGRTLEGPLTAIRDWAELHINEIEAARAGHDAESRDD